MSAAIGRQREPRGRCLIRSQVKWFASAGLGFRQDIAIARIGRNQLVNPRIIFSGLKGLNGDQPPVGEFNHRAAPESAHSVSVPFASRRLTGIVLMGMEFLAFYYEHVADLLAHKIGLLLSITAAPGRSANESGIELSL
jgi:hypothetical protein